MPASPASGRLSSVAEARAKYADQAPTFDAQLASVSRKHPGLKGVVGTGDGTTYRVIVDGGAPSAVPGGTASAALRRDLAEAFGASVAQVRVEEAPAVAMAQGGQAERPDFHVLNEVRVGLRRFLMETEWVNMLDVDDERGRVLVGTATAADEGRVRAEMAPDELSVTDFVRSKPDEVAVGRTPFVLNTAASGGTSANGQFRSLRSSAFRPLIAGAQVWFTTPAGETSFCTQGPAVRFRDGSYGFLTNSHCTFDFFRVTGVRFFQPYVAEEVYLGIESAEPAFRSGWSVRNGFYSDAAFIRTQPSVELQGRMTSADNCSRASPDCIENGVLTDVTGYATYLAVNSRAFKTGRTTGTTAGRVFQTCVDVTQSGYNVRIYCNSRVTRDPSIPTNGSRMGDGGDSGSAVLANGGVPGSNAAGLAGMLWGGDEDGTYFTFSPWENIWQNDRAGTQYGLAVTGVLSQHGTVRTPISGGGGGGELPPECPDPEVGPYSLPPPECRL